MMEQKIEVQGPIIVSDMIEGYEFIIFDAPDTAHFFKKAADGKLVYDGYDREASKCTPPNGSSPVTKILVMDAHEIGELKEGK